MVLLLLLLLLLMVPVVAHTLVSGCGSVVAGHGHGHRRGRQQAMMVMMTMRTRTSTSGATPPIRASKRRAKVILHTLHAQIIRLPQPLSLPSSSRILSLITALPTKRAILIHPIVLILPTHIPNDELQLSRDDHPELLVPHWLLDAGDARAVPPFVEFPTESVSFGLERAKLLRGHEPVPP